MLALMLNDYSTCVDLVPFANTYTYVHMVHVGIYIDKHSYVSNNWLISRMMVAHASKFVEESKQTS